MIGKLEELTLMAVLRAGRDSHAAKIFRVVDEGAPGKAQFAAIYTTLDRMKTKGYLSETSDPGDPRGKRLFSITGEGRKKLDEAMNASAALGGFTWKGVQEIGGNGK